MGGGGNKFIIVLTLLSMVVGSCFLKKKLIVFDRAFKGVQTFFLIFAIYI